MSVLGIEDRAETIGGQVLRGLLISPAEVWFPYSVEAVKLLREGLILAVRNTASVHLNQIAAAEEDQHFSLLRIDSVDTRHFVIDQIRQDRSDTPISVEGLLQKHQQEWRRRAEDPEENNLRIVASVTETGLELHFPMAAAPARGFEERVANATGSTMLGEVAYLVEQGVVQGIVNRGMPLPDVTNKVVVAGTHTLYRSPPLDVLIDTDALFRRHLGIFGFTGAGKSNLLSSLVSRSLAAGNDDEGQGEANVLLFDVNNEFFGLLIDALVDYDAHIVFLDDEIGKAMSAFLGGDYSQLSNAAEEFLRTATFSSAVKRATGSGDSFQNLLTITKALLASGRFKRLEQTQDHMGLNVVLLEILAHADDLRSQIKGTGQGKKRDAWNALVSEVSGQFEDLNRTVTAEDFVKVLVVLDMAHGYCSSASDDTDDVVSAVLRKHLPKDAKENFYADLVDPIDSLRNFVLEKGTSFDAPLRVRGHSIDLSGLFGALHDNKRTLVLFLGAENSLRYFAHELGMLVYDQRRRNGIVDPATIFIFDEADIFIPGQAASPSEEERDAIKFSKKIATTLSRRGRKYGLGLGIATQRIAYLDTSILAQLGTYFVGRLPRLSDRQKITEGFGVDKDSLQTGIRGVGDWVVLSHTAVGDRGAPLPVHFDNADERITSFIEGFDLGKYIDLESMVSRFDYIKDLEGQKDSLTSPVTDSEFLP